jgi:hypothetical protein
MAKADTNPEGRPRKVVGVYERPEHSGRSRMLIGVVVAVVAVVIAVAIWYLR